jgi:thymidylate synthase
VKDGSVKNDALIIRQRLMVFQQNGSGEQKIAGLRRYGAELFELDVFNIDELLPPVLDNTSDYLPQDISCDLVLDFLRHNDLSTDLATLCMQKNIPVIASGKKITCNGLFTPPT